MALTTDQRQKIVDLRLAGITIRTVAEETDHAPQTVQRVWREYLAGRAQDRRDEIEAHHQELIERFVTQAQEAREEALLCRREGDRVGHRAYLREEREALREVVKLTGLDAPLRVDVSGQVNVTVSDDREALKARLVALCQSPN
jgi:hypothetical protein